MERVDVPGSQCARGPPGHVNTLNETLGGRQRGLVEFPFHFLPCEAVQNNPQMTISC